ncbi:FAD-binding oxidoreductase [Falsirhodobacter algicola]|uniref:FAD-binding protein n=1 Tax=Falsirhodobacter algicola TaxID=2692330 RepID=A0A8J8MR17_9RHOB|nr:FAD-binding oxidoreductase [Falsirhodobacter algicola]QUS35135.1 FAD-binding protein [Falsirhodobacter algicola]
MNDAGTTFLAALEARLPPDTLRAPEPRHLSEPRGKFPGRAAAVALPRSAAEVSTILAACHAARVAVVPVGGGTGLVGGQVMTDGPLPLLLSTERMTAIRAVHPSENVLVAEAGAILADVQAAAEGAGRLFPLSLASEGSARIGGLLSTNAGGLNVLRYGTARELCLGVEAVLADGSVMNGLRRLRKDNTGYDLRHLLIGAEGTLGIITAASLKLLPRPAAYATAILTVPHPEAALALLGRAGAHAPGLVEAFELISGESLRFLAETMPDLRRPVPKAEWLVLMELGLPPGLDGTALLEAIFADGAERGLVEDGVLAQSEAQRQDIWTLRESIPEANRRIGAIASHDVALPLSHVATFIEEAAAALRPFGIRINCFGHLGDGNLHFNVFPAAGRVRGDYADAAADITRIVHDLVAAHEGSFSAEHGVGRLKVADLERYGDPVKLAAMRAIKAALDPHGILNPGAVLRM